MSNSFSPPVNSQHRFAHIDAMRAFAVLVVVLAHAGLGHVVPGGSGVTIFFSISGFVITFIVLKEMSKTDGFDIGRFYRNRAYKILPPLLVAIVLPTLIWSMWSTVNWAAVLGQVFFYYNWFKVNGGADVLPGTGVVWSLSIEEQFYLVFAIVWFFLVNSRSRVAVLAVLACACVIGSTATRLALFADGTSHDRIYYGSDTRLDGIAYGVLLGVAYYVWTERGSKPNAVTSIVGHWLALATGISLYILSLVIRDEFFRDTFRYSLQSLSACIVIAFGLVPGIGLVRRVFYAISESRIVTAIGLSSYSIYLCHLIVGNVFRNLTSAWPLGLRVLVTASLGVAAGYLLYRAVELPVQEYKRKRRPVKQGESGL
jgi:peptidoglycan/LPS O-acetylase OafA/YrhL